MPLGTVIKVSNGRKYVEILILCPNCGAEAGKIADLPDDAPEGFIAFIDTHGVIRYVEEDPHDYR